MHLVLLGNTTVHEVHITRLVPLHLQCARLERPLLADKAMEDGSSHLQGEGLCGRTKWHAKDDEVLSDARRMMYIAALCPLCCRHC
jgi:hypothetical protein